MVTYHQTSEFPSIRQSVFPSSQLEHAIMQKELQMFNETWNIEDRSLEIMQIILISTKMCILRAVLMVLFAQRWRPGPDV
jgi:hypothetical protein